MNNEVVTEIKKKPPTLKDKVNRYIGKQAELYFRTYKAVKAEAELDDIELSAEDLRTITTSIFIATQKKFKLTEPDRSSK